MAIRSTLRDNHCFFVVARQCFVDVAQKDTAKPNECHLARLIEFCLKLFPSTRNFHTEVRHVQVEAGIRVVGEAAWRSCQRLQVVHLPDTVVCLRHGAFRRCYLLCAVMAPECKQFGVKVFEARCSLTQIGVTQHTSYQFVPAARF